jgi:hypothetical protein
MINDARRHVAVFGLSCALVLTTAGCGGATALEEIPLGSQVTIETEDGSVITGALADVSADRVVVESDDAGDRREFSRDNVTEVRRETGGIGDLLSFAPEPVALTIPAESTVSIELETTVTSDGNQLEDPVRARTREPVMVGERVALPAGSELRGTITGAKASGKVEGRAQLSFRFTDVRAYGETYAIRTEPFVYEAAGTKAEDAKKIGIGAAAGAIIGGLTGGKKGAAVGSAVGGGAGTALVVTTPGDEVEVRSGSALTMQLTDALTVQVPREDS